MATALQGNPVALKDQLIAVGSSLPDYRLTRRDLSQATPADHQGTVRIINIAPSLDTGVCAAQLKRFNSEAAALDGVTVMMVTADLPFAQERFCVAEGVDKVEVLSDLRDRGFGQRLGLAIADGPLEGVMARAILVVGADNLVKYVQLVPEITEEPNYEAAIYAAKSELG